MNQSTQKLRTTVERLKAELAQAESQLASAVRSCNHQWSAIEAAHIYHEGYTIPGDPPGTMGVDWRGPCHVSARTEKRWKRTCRICGEVEFTSNVTETVVETPKFY